MASFLQGYQLCRSCHGDWFNAEKLSLFPRPPQFLNFTLVPLYVRTTFTGCCAFVWAIFLCFSQQSGDGTVGAALEWMFPAKRVEAETGEIDSSGQTDTPQDWSLRAQKRQQRWFCGRCLFITGHHVTPLGALEPNFLFNTALLLTYSCKTGMCEGRNCLHGGSYFISISIRCDLYWARDV